MADTASSGKARREACNYDLTDFVVFLILAVAAAAGWLLFWTSVCCISFDMMATCARVCFEMFAPAGLKRNRIQARAAQYAWPCGKQTSCPAAKAALQPNSPSGSDMPAHGQSETPSRRSSIPEPGSVQRIQQQAAATVAVTAAVTDPSNSEESAATASGDGANTASAASALARRVQHEELEGSTVEIFPDTNWEEQQQVDDVAMEALAAASRREEVPSSPSCAKFAADASDDWAMLAGASAAFELDRKEQDTALEQALLNGVEGEDSEEQAEVAWDMDWAQQQQAHAEQLNTGVVEWQKTRGEDNILNPSSTASLSDDSAAAASYDWASMVAASAAFDLAHQKQHEERSGLQKGVLEISPDLDWEEQQQVQNEALRAAGKAPQGAAAAQLAAELQEIDRQLCSMDLNLKCRSRLFQAHIEDLELDGLDWQATYKEDSTQLPEDVLSMVDEAVAKAYSHPLAVICCELEL